MQFFLTGGGYHNKSMHTPRNVRPLSRLFFSLREWHEAKVEIFFFLFLILTRSAAPQFQTEDEE